MRFLVTAGGTREPVDKVRYWGNIFTGGTGWDIAQHLLDLGPVLLLTSNPQHLVEAEGYPGLEARPFVTHADLRAGLERAMAGKHPDAVVMTAAVADYTPEAAFEIVRRRTLRGGTEQWTVRNVQAPKVSSRHQAIAIAAQRTEKLVDLFRSRWHYRGILVKFKLEVGLTTRELLRVAEASRQASGADLLVANTLAMVNGRAPGAYLLGDGTPKWIRRAQIGARISRLIMQLRDKEC
jgi:phosphopantothenoylcysteine synthetase/decarboxylase